MPSLRSSTPRHHAEKNLIDETTGLIMQQSWPNKEGRNKRIKQKNYVLLGILLLMIAVVYFVAVIKLSN